MCFITVEKISNFTKSPPMPSASIIIDADPIILIIPPREKILSIVSIPVFEAYPVITTFCNDEFGAKNTYIINALIIPMSKLAIAGSLRQDAMNMRSMGTSVIGETKKNLFNDCMVSAIPPDTSFALPPSII